MGNPLSIIPPKVRAWIYAVLVIANIILTPLMAAGFVPSLIGAIILGLTNAFGAGVALSNVPKRDALADVASLRAGIR